MRNRFDQQLELLNKQLIHMGELCEEAIGKATTALKEGSMEQAEKVRIADEQIDNPLDEHIGGLGLLGIDHMDVVVLLDGAGASGHAVSIKYQDEHAFLVALIVAQNVHQLAAGGVQAFL